MVLVSDLILEKNLGFWTLIFNITLLFIEAGAPTWMRIFAHPEAMDYGVALCPLGLEQKDVIFCTFYRCIRY